MAEPILAAHAVTKVVRDGSRETQILDGISLSVAPGERVALLGRSGAGKSTLLHILGALDPDYTGSVTIAGRTLTSMKDAELSAFRNRTVGFLFQAYNLLSHLTALENVYLPARFATGAPDLDRARQVLDEVGLAHKAQQRPETLSGGERQRVALARALYHQPKVVLCDEPTGNLDRQTGQEILSLFAELQKRGAALVVATHDASIADTAARVLTLCQGRLQ